MTKADLVDKVAQALTDSTEQRISKKFARQILDAVTGVMGSELVENSGLSLSGFGHFRVSERSYTVFPGKPGEKKDKSLATKVSRRNATFRPAKALKVALNGVTEVPSATPVETPEVAE